MKFRFAAPLRLVQPRQWLALALSVALGSLMVSALLFGLKPLSALAAAPAAPAAVYPCSEPGLDSALATGGSATFSCGSVTTVTLSARKTVSHNVSLDGASKLILSGNDVTGVFTVPAGIHLTLLNIELYDARTPYFGGDVANNGILSVTNSQFISNTAPGGAAIYNAPGASAVISGSQINHNFGEGGAILNGNNVVSATASVSLVNTVFLFNEGAVGAAIYNWNGQVNIIGGGFGFNAAEIGGAIYDVSHLNVQGSLFEINGAFLLGPLSRPAALQQPAGGIGVLGGGAIYLAAGGDALVASSAFTANFGLQAGGAILYGTLPLDSNVTLSPGGLTLVSDEFDQNCTSGAGGAVASSLTTSVSDSRFTENGAFSNGCAFLNQQAQARFQTSAPSRPAIILPSYLLGPGGAIFSDGPLAVANTTFLSNTASVTTTGGGGAIENFDGSQLAIQDSAFTANTAWQDGGAIFNNHASIATVINSAFTHNTVITDSGGAIANQGALTVTLGTFTANSGAPAHGSIGLGGGAIASAPGGILLDSSATNGSDNGPPDRAGNGGSNGIRPLTGPRLVIPGNWLYVDHSTFVSNHSEYEGGAIDAADANVLASTFESNTAAYGGAIDVLSDNFLISSSTFSTNAVVNTSVATANEGGALDSNTHHIGIANSTFFDNHAPAGAHGGAINGDGGALTMTNSTLISNTAVDPNQGGALSGNGLFVLRNTIIAYSLGGNCQFTMTMTVANLEFPGTTCGGASLQLDPRALAPADNGGPTLTSALLLGSPAIDAGNDGVCPGTDQRGAPRPVGSHCDLGAFEFGGLVPRLWLPAIR